VSEHLARVCLCSDRFDRAESLFRYVCEERKHSLGESHPKSRLAARNLAIAIGSRVGDGVVGDGLVRDGVVRDGVSGNE